MTEPISTERSLRGGRRVGAVIGAGSGVTAGSAGTVGSVGTDAPINAW